MKHPLLLLALLIAVTFLLVAPLTGGPTPQLTNELIIISIVVFLGGYLLADVILKRFGNGITIIIALLILAAIVYLWPIFSI